MNTKQSLHCKAYSLCVAMTKVTKHDVYSN